MRVISEPVTSFRGRRLPIAARLAGYAALMAAHDLAVPLHHEMAATATRNTRRKQDGWLILPAGQMPGPRAVDNLVFALKHEGIQLLTLKKVFQAIDRKELEDALRERPTSAYVRRLCFFYEWFFGTGALSVPDTAGGAYVDAVDSRQQYVTRVAANVRRFRVRDNLPGLAEFCPLVFRTHSIDDFIAQDFGGKATDVVGSFPRELIARAAAFLLLSDSKASFAIEGETPPKDRLARWGHVIGKAGRSALSLESLADLQRELIGDDRFVHLGLRDQGGFIGRHDPLGNPEPEHISANPADLTELLGGILDFDGLSRDFDYDPVLTAASVAFGFVYIHPFEDGNGRLHRFLLHHVLAARGLTPREIVFPISSVILDDIARYKDVLESVSRPLLGLIRWTPTEQGNVAVEPGTADFYRYFDATVHAEYLFRCLKRAIEQDLPEELSFLEQRDRFHRRITEIVDMGERTLDLLLRFLRQERGRLSRRARNKEFARLTQTEVDEIEDVYDGLFGQPEA